MAEAEQQAIATLRQLSEAQTEAADMRSALGAAKKELKAVQNEVLAAKAAKFEATQAHTGVCLSVRRNFTTL